MYKIHKRAQYLYGGDMHVYYFRTHERKIIEVGNLTEFCKKHGLSARSMRSLSNRKIRTHKGFYYSNSDQYTGYKLGKETLEITEGYKPLGDAFNLWLKSKSEQLGVSEAYMLNDMTTKYKRSMRSADKSIDK